MTTAAGAPDPAKLAVGLPGPGLRAAAAAHAEVLGGGEAQPRRVHLRLETGESIALKRRESAYFDSGVRHIHLPVSKADAQVVVMEGG